MANNSSGQQYFGLVQAQFYFAAPFNGYSK